MRRVLNPLTSISVLCASFLAIAGCDKNKPTPVSPAPPSAAQPAPSKEDDAKAVSEFLNKDKGGAGTPTGALPPGHPPIDGSAAPPAGATPPAGLPQGHPPIDQAGGMGMAPAPAADLDAIIYSAPKTWTPQAPSSQMRKAQFLIPRASGDTEDGQMVVFYFGAGQGGAVEANIDRWKGMFTSADGKPVADSAVKRESHEVNGMKVTTLDITGRYVDPMAGRPAAAPKESPKENPQEYRMLSAIAETPDGPWFFKGVGPVATMKAQEQNFKDFVASFKGKP